jgi:hypothetical protein
MTLRIMSWRNLKFVMLKVNLLNDHNLPKGKIASKKEGQVKSVSEIVSLASLHLRKIKLYPLGEDTECS